MGLDLQSVGRRGTATSWSWTERDAALYALGIGAGQNPLDPDELPFVCERSVYPTMALAIGVAGGDRPGFGTIDRSRFVHSAQTLEIHRPLPLAGTATLECDIVGIHDVGSGALVSWRTSAEIDGAPLFTMVSTGFLIGGGGFGGEQPAADGWTEPEGPPDLDVPMPTTAQQALVYRLSGDRNPLHSDPATARRGGFARPILHGLSVLGGAVRVLFGARAGDLRRLGARFTAPVLPGDMLRVHGWSRPDGIAFRVLDDAGRTVVDRGEAIA